MKNPPTRLKLLITLFNSKIQYGRFSNKSYKYIFNENHIFPFKRLSTLKPPLIYITPNRMCDTKKKTVIRQVKFIFHLVVRKG